MYLYILYNQMLVQLGQSIFQKYVRIVMMLLEWGFYKNTSFHNNFHLEFGIWLVILKYSNGCRSRASDIFTSETIFFLLSFGWVWIPISFRTDRMGLHLGFVYIYLVPMCIFFYHFFRVDENNCLCTVFMLSALVYVSIYIAKNLSLYQNWCHS